MSITPVAPAPEPPESSSRLGPIGRARASVAAIEILLRLREDQDDPTEGELGALRQWPGWGPLAPALAPNREGTWAEIGEQLQRLLSPREYRHAEQGTPTAYYTPDRITEACWSALQGLGFNGGRVLEPGCGAGTFIKHTPDGLNVDWFGVERDPTTAGIAALLHPGAEIINARLQDASLQSNSVDAVLGNVPYGNFQVFDKTAPKAVTSSIHNYFIWRSVQALRPGGVAILLTSRYTMDASDDTARRAIAKHADLLGAIRLPNGALAEGGTGVLADILVVRRRDTEGPTDESWMGTSAVPGVDDQQCNDYFLANPSHVLGTWEQGRAAQYGHTLAVQAPEEQDLTAVLGEAFADITTKARAAGRQWKVIAGAQPWTADNLPFPVRDDGRKEGSFHLVEGKPHEVIDGELVAVARAGKELPKLIRLRDATVALIEAETDHDRPDEQLEPLRAEVNRLYDLYARAHGPINRFTIAQGEVDEETGEAAVSRRYPRLGGFRRDPDFVAVLALEDFDDETQTATKAALQTRRVNKRIERPTSAETPEEALSLCLNFRNQVDVPYIAQLLSIEPDQVAEALGDLVFIDPDTEDLLTVGEYLSGPVVDKLERVEFLVSQGRDDLQRHADALREVQPEPLQPEDIKARLGAPWIPVEDVTAFAEELLGVDVDITHVAKTATWSVDTPMTIPESAISEWGTNRVTAFELLDLALNGQSPKVYDTFRTPEGGSKRVRNDKATLLAETKLTDLQRHFASWVWEDPERSDRLAADYNRRFNSTVLRKNDGSHLTVDGLDTGFITPYAHQWDFVQRVLSADEGSLCPFPVGAGKTATMFMTALKLKQLGLVSKPMVVVPNHLLEQIARDGKKLFPQANILMAGKKDLADARARMLFAARCATGDWDTIVMTHQSFGRLGVHPVTEATYLEELANDYREALGAIDGDDGNQRRIKEIAKQVDRFDARASDLRSKAVDAGVTYENLGVDFLQVDEAHLFKNLALPAVTEGMSLGKPSKRATDLDLKILVTRERTGRDNVVALYSGTFISNSVREMYVFKHYTMPERLEQIGLGNADAWAANHINFETRPEVGVDGVSFRLKRRPVDYVNADEAVALFNEVAELRPREDFKIERPEREERFVEIEATPNLIRYVEGISGRIDDIQGGKVKPWQDNMLNVITDGRKAALDLELVGLAPDGPGKVGAVVRNVLEIHNQTKNLKFPGDPEDVEGALQLLFCDLGTPGKERGSQVYGKIRRGLIDGLPNEGLPGIPRERIKFIHDYNSDLAKEQLFTDSRSGKVNVLFMSSQKGGTGVNVQPRGVALHHVDPPHRPDEWEQREGRLDRPGNKMIKLGKPVTFLRYLALHSFDSYMFQQLERKQRPIVQILSGRKVGRVIEEIDAVGAGFGAAKAMVSGNPLLMELTTVNGQLQTLLNEADGHRQSQGRMQRKVELLDQEIAQGERSLAPMQAMADAVATAADDDTWRTADGRLVQPDDVAAALAESAQGARSTLDLDAGYTWRGLNVGFTWHRKQQFGNIAYESYAHLVVPGEHQVDVRLNLPWFGKGQTWRIAKALGEAADAAVSAPDELRVKVAKMRASLEDTRPHLGRPFGKHAELEDVRARRAALEAQIADAAVSSGRESGAGPQFDPGAVGAEMTEAEMAMHDAAVMVGMMGGSAIVRSEGQIVGTVRTRRGPAPAEEPPRPHLENPDRWDEALKAVTDAGLAAPDVIAWAQSNAADSAFVGAFGEWTRAWVEQVANTAQDRPEWVHAYLDDRAYAARDELHSQAAVAVRQQARAAGAEPAPAPSVTNADGPEQAEPSPEMVKVAAILRYYEPLFERHGLTGAAAAANYVTRPGYGYDYDPDSPLPDLTDRISGAADRARGHFRTGPTSSVTYEVGQTRQEAGELLADISISLVNLMTDTGEGYGAVDLDVILAAPHGSVVPLPPLSSAPPTPRTAGEAGTGAAPAAPAPTPPAAPTPRSEPAPAPQPAAATSRLTDPHLWEEGLRILRAGAEGVEQLERAARVNDSANFAIVFADWAEDWLMDQYTGPTADWPEWARRYFGAGEEAYQDRERLHAAASTAVYERLRTAADPVPAAAPNVPAPAAAQDGTAPQPAPSPLQGLIDGFGDRVVIGHIGGPQAARTHQSAGWAIRAVLSEEQVLGLVSAVTVDGQPVSMVPGTVPTERVRAWIVEQQQAPTAAYYADTSSSLPPALRGNGEVHLSTNAEGLTIAQRDVGSTILWEELPAWIDAAVAHDTATRSASLPAWRYGRLDHELHFLRDNDTQARAQALDALYVALKEGPPPSDVQLAASRDRYEPPPAPAAHATDTEQTQPQAPPSASDEAPEPEPQPLPTEPVPGAEGYTYLETGRTVALYDSTGEQVGHAKWSYTKYRYEGDVRGDVVRGTDEAATVAKRMAHHHDAVYGQGIHHPALDEQDRDPVWILHNGSDTLVFGIRPEDSTAKAALWTGGGFKDSRRAGGWYLPRTWKEPTRRARVDTAVRVLAAAGRTVLVHADREERRRVEPPAGLPVLDVTAPNLEEVPALFAAGPYTSEAEIQADSAGLADAYARWSQLPLVQAYVAEDHDARPDGFGTPRNPIAELRIAYARAEGALRGDALGGPPELLRRLYSVAAWSQALEPAVNEGLLAPLQELYAAAHLLAARSQATIESVAAGAAAAPESADTQQQTDAPAPTDPSPAPEDGREPVVDTAENGSDPAVPEPGTAESAVTAEDVSGGPPVIDDEFSILYGAFRERLAPAPVPEKGDASPEDRDAALRAAYRELRDTPQSIDGARVHFLLGQTDEQDGVLADTTTVMRLIDSGLLEYAVTAIAITPAGRERIAELERAGREEPAVGDRVLLVGSGTVGIVGGYRTNDHGVRWADVVYEREGWPDGVDTSVGALFMTTIEPAAMDPAAAAELYRVAALRQRPGTLTDPAVRAAALEAFTAAALADPQVAQAARANDFNNFVPALASRMSTWAEQQWAEAAETERPDWVGVFFREDDDAIHDLNGLYSQLAGQLYGQLRPADTPEPAPDTAPAQPSPSSPTPTEAEEADDSEEQLDLFGPGQDPSPPGREGQRQFPYRSRVYHDGWPYLVESVSDDGLAIHGFGGHRLPVNEVTPEEDMPPVTTRLLAKGWWEYSYQGRTYTATNLPEEMTRGRLATLRAVLADEDGTLVGRHFNRAFDQDIIWAHTHPGVPTPHVAGWLRGGHRSMWPEFTAEEQAYVMAGPPDEQMALDLDAGAATQQPGEGSADEEDENLTDEAAVDYDDDLEHEVSVPGEEAVPAAEPPIAEDTPVPAPTPTPAPDQARDEQQPTAAPSNGPETSPGTTSPVPAPAAEPSPTAEPVASFGAGLPGGFETYAHVYREGERHNVESVSEDGLTVNVGGGLSFPKSELTPAADMPPVTSRRLAEGWWEFSYLDRTYVAAMLSAELARGTLANLSVTLVDENGDLVGRTFGAPGNDDIYWVHAHPGEPGPLVRGWLGVGGDRTWPEYSDRERAYMTAGPPAEQMAFDIDAGAMAEHNGEGPVDEEDEDLLDAAPADLDADDPEYEVSVPGEDTVPAAEPPIVAENPEHAPMPDPTPAPEPAAAVDPQETAAAPAAATPSEPVPAAVPPELVTGPLVTLGLREGPGGQLVFRVDSPDAAHALVLPGISTADLPGLGRPATAQVPMLVRAAQLAEQLVSSEETAAWLAAHLPDGPLAAAWHNDQVQTVLIVVVRDTLRDGMAPSVDDVATWLVNTAVEQDTLLRAAHAAADLDAFAPEFARAADALVADGGSEHLLWTFLGQEGVRRAQVLAQATPGAYEQLLAAPAPAPGPERAAAPAPAPTEPPAPSPEDSQMATPAPQTPEPEESAAPAAPTPPAAPAEPAPEPAAEAAAVESPEGVPAVDVEDPPAPRSYTDVTPLAVDAAYELHLLGVDDRMPEHGELRLASGGLRIAMLAQAVGGQWSARLDLEGLPYDVTPLVTTPQEAADNAALMYSLYTGAAYGPMPTAVVDADAQVAGDVLREELETLATLHRARLANAATQLPLAQRAYFVELDDRITRLGLAAVEAHGSQHMATNLNEVSEAARAWGRALPADERRALAYPLAHLMYDARSARVRLESTLASLRAEAVAREASATAAPASPTPQEVQPAPDPQPEAEPATATAQTAQPAPEPSPSVPATAEAETADQPGAPETVGDTGETAEQPEEATVTGQGDPEAPLEDRAQPDTAPAAENALVSSVPEEALQEPPEPEIAMPHEDPHATGAVESEGPASVAGQPSDAVTAAAPPADLPLWVSAGETAVPQPAAPSGEPDLLANFRQVQEAWEAVVPSAGGTAAELVAEVRDDLIALQAFIDDGVDGTAPEPAPVPEQRVVPAPEGAAQTAGDNPPERDQQQAASAVNVALRHADTHAASLKDLPEWQRIQTARGAFGHLMSVLRERAGERFDQLLGDGKVSDFLRDVSARFCDKVAKLATAGAERLRRGAKESENPAALPSAEALLRLGDAAVAYNRPSGGNGTQWPAGGPGEQSDAPALVKLGEALARPLPEDRRKVSASAARSRSSTAKRPAKKPAPGSTEQTTHLRRGGPDQQPPRRPTR